MGVVAGVAKTGESACPTSQSGRTGAFACLKLFSYEAVRDSSFVTLSNTSTVRCAILDAE